MNGHVGRRSNVATPPTSRLIRLPPLGWGVSMFLYVACPHKRGVIHGHLPGPTPPAVRPRYALHGA